MQIRTRLRWRNAMVKSDGSGSKGLTPYTCLCYRCCALEQSTWRRALKGSKQSARPCGPYWIFFHRSVFLSNLRLPRKQSFPKIFHCIEYIFYHSWFLSNFALALKNRVCPKFFTVLNILYTFRIFEQFAVALKNRVCPEFTVLNIYVFIVRDFCATCACPEKQNCSKIFHWIEIIFYYSGFLSNLRLPWNFSSQGWRRSPQSPRLVRLCITASFLINLKTEIWTVERTPFWYV